MIHAILVVNNYGKARLLKFYTPMDEERQQRAMREVFSVISKRHSSVCNFVEGGGASMWGPDTKLVYRHYATLYFVFVVDHAESELGILDLIQVFVETLDKCFENVAELDLIFNSTAIHHILDEIVLGGMVLDTNMSTILAGVQDMAKLDSSSSSLATTRTSAPVRNTTWAWAAGGIS